MSDPYRYAMLAANRGELPQTFRPSEYVVRHAITYQPPEGSLFHRAVDREQWPITRFARELQTRTALQALREHTARTRAWEQYLAAEAQPFKPRRLFGFGGPW